jgi:hypothetical protein
MNQDEYLLVAEAISTSENVNDVVRSLCGLFALNDEHFNVSRFREACGI